MTTFQTFERDLRLATAGCEPQAVAAALAALAKRELAAAIGRGEASPHYTRIVNGRVGAPEESVIPPGPIVYNFASNLWPAVIGFAIEYLRNRSPKDSGAYRDSFVVIANGRVRSGSYAGVSRRALLGGQVSGPMDIAADAQVIITNTQPYTRKIEVGGMRMRVPSGVFKDAESAVQAEYGDAVRVKTEFVRLHAGIAPGLPYILKGRKRRKDSRRGQPLTYPSLVLTMLVTD